MRPYCMPFSRVHLFATMPARRVICAAAVGLSMMLVPLAAGPAKAATSVPPGSSAHVYLLRGQGGVGPPTPVFERVLTVP